MDDINESTSMSLGRDLRALDAMNKLRMWMRLTTLGHEPELKML